jgi:hypothetical protein
MNMDGTVAAYRLGALLSGNSVVFKQDSPYHEHYYYLLREYEHFIPVKRDLSDLMEKITWAKNNDEATRKISNNARKLMRTHMRPEDIWYAAEELGEEGKIEERKRVGRGLPQVELLQQPESRGAGRGRGSLMSFEAES